MNLPLQIPREARWRRPVPNPAAPPVSRGLLECFARYSKFYIRKHFSAVLLSGAAPNLSAGGPFVVFLNHASWWDPLMCLLAARRFSWHAANYAAIDRDSLAKFKFFRKLGFFPVEKGTTRGAVQFLNTAEALLSSPGTVLWITPQGQFVDQRERPVLLRRGLLHLARRVPSASFIPVAIDYFFGEDRLPLAALRFGPPLRPQSIHELESALERTMDQLAAEVMSRSVLSGEPLSRGRTGIGGIYGVWQKLRGA